MKFLNLIGGWRTEKRIQYMRFILKLHYRLFRKYSVLAPIKKIILLKSIILKIAMFAVGLLIWKQNFLGRDLLINLR